MNRSSSPWVLVTAIAVVLTGLVALQGQNTANPRPAVIAVVDVQKVVGAMAERSAIDADLMRRKDELDRTRADKEQELKALQADLGVLGPDSGAFKETEQKLTEKMIGFRVWQEIESQKLESEKAIQMEALYRKLVDAIGRLAKKNNYDLVLYKDETDAARGKTQQQVATIITLRKVLYSAPEMDITDQITQMLNNEFNNKK